jgi:ribonucleoside-diphosphate reductase alpha chain
VRNPSLKKVLAKHGRDDEETWTSITVNKGSVQHLDFLEEQEKAVFKTAFELDQRWVVEHAADRTPFICQSQSVNLFLPADVHKRDLHQIHFQAWKKGVKSLYYCRSLSIQRADAISEKVALQPKLGLAESLEAVLPLTTAVAAQAESTDYEECLACQ